MPAESDGPCRLMSGQALVASSSHHDRHTPGTDAGPAFAARASWLPLARRSADVPRPGRLRGGWMTSPSRHESRSQLIGRGGRLSDRGIPLADPSRSPPHSRTPHSPDRRSVEPVYNRVPTKDSPAHHPHIRHTNSISQVRKRLIRDSRLGHGMPTSRRSVDDLMPKSMARARRRSPLRTLLSASE